MANPICQVLLISCALMAATAEAADPPSKPVTISISELKFFAGSWEGSLEYLDYGDGKTRVRLPTAIRYEPKENSINYTTTFTEPNGSKVKDKGGIRPIGDGAKLYFDGRAHQVLSKEIDQEKETFQIVLTNTGKDNKQPATFTTTILRRKSSLQITKAVKYDGQDSSFVRNKYSFERVE